MSRPTVNLWRNRYAERGLAGLARVRPPGRPRSVDRAKVITATLTPPPKRLGVTHWSSRLLADRLGIEHSTPTSGSWLNLVEVCFGIIERQAIRRGSFTSVRDLMIKIRGFITGWKQRKHPFIWTKPPDQILATINRKDKHA